MKEVYNTKDELKFPMAFMTAYVIHIVGDIHQPFHTSEFHLEGEFDNGDRGGNDYLTTFPDLPNLPKDKQNTHKSFDNLLYQVESLKRVVLFNLAFK